jgi:hypothetical protein
MVSLPASPLVMIISTLGSTWAGASFSGNFNCR